MEHMQQTIVEKLFEEFLKTLDADEAVDSSVVRRLRAAILERVAYRPDDLRRALFAEDDLP